MSPVVIVGIEVKSILGILIFSGIREASFSIMSGSKGSRSMHDFNFSSAVDSHDISGRGDVLRGRVGVSEGRVKADEFRVLVHGLKGFIAAAASLVRFSFLEKGESRRGSGVASGTGAALDFRRAVGVLADEFALGFRAVGLVTLPVALGFLADGLALRLRCLAVSHTVGLLADCHALGAVEHLAAFIGALDLALRLLAFHIADGIFGFGAG